MKASGSCVFKNNTEITEVAKTCSGTTDAITLAAESIQAELLCIVSPRGNMLP